MNHPTVETECESHEPTRGKPAIAFVLERVSRLPKEDQQDFFDLVKIIVTTQDDEEIQAAIAAIAEIIEDAPCQPLSQVFPVSSKDANAKWKAYISQKIRTARLENKMTQVQLSELAGIEQATLSRIESGKSSPSSHTVAKIARALGLKPGDLDPSLVDQ